MVLKAASEWFIWCCEKVTPSTSSTLLTVNQNIHYNDFLTGVIISRSTMGKGKGKRAAQPALPPQVPQPPQQTGFFAMPDVHAPRDYIPLAQSITIIRNTGALTLREEESRLRRSCVREEQYR
jgi:hypothetical protein